MRQFAKFLISQVIVMAILIIALVVTAVFFQPVEIDPVVLNDYVQTVKTNWEHPEIIGNTEFAQNILVLDRYNKVTYSSSNQIFKGIKSPFDALEKGMITVAVNDEGNYLGTLVIQNASKLAYERMTSRIVLVVILGALELLACYGVFFWYVNRNIIKPFGRLKRFAGVIARGELDEPLIMERSNIFGVFTESFDIMREELKAAREREIALKMKEKELVASLSHDLKTPVTGIKVMCEMLEVKVEDEYVRHKIKNISNKTMEINQLLDDLLASTLDDLGEWKVQCVDTASDCLEGILEAYDPRKMVHAGEVPKCLIHVDTKRMAQVIGNIITNSYKYASTTIEVSYAYQEGFLEMTLKDYGEGVDDEELEFLTHKFFRGKKNTTNQEGSGLGLYISSELMKMMQGQLICRNDREGFVVILRIPLA